MSNNRESLAGANALVAIPSTFCLSEVESTFMPSTLHEEQRRLCLKYILHVAKLSESVQLPDCNIDFPLASTAREHGRTPQR